MPTRDKLLPALATEIDAEVQQIMTLQEQISIVRLKGNVSPETGRLLEGLAQQLGERYFELVSEWMRAKRKETNNGQG